MTKTGLEQCFAANQLIITEGGVGQRIEREFALKPDPDIMYAALLYNAAGRAALASVYKSYLQVAQQYQLPILLLTNTRRANKERVLRSGYKSKNMMKDYAYFLRELSAGYNCDAFIGGMMGCRGDAYSGTEGMNTKEAVQYHMWQMEMFDPQSVDFFFAGIMPTLPEAIGTAQVMQTAGLPYIISLMINRSGQLPDGTTIHNAICAIDAATQRRPLCYMTNCVHPTILKEALAQPVNQTQLVKTRFCGIQANASALSAQQLDNSEQLQTTDAKQLAQDFAQLHSAFPLKIYGGCCGTDDTHIAEMICKLRLAL